MPSRQKEKVCLLDTIEEQQEEWPQARKSAKRDILKWIGSICLFVLSFWLYESVLSSVERREADHLAPYEVRQGYVEGSVMRMLSYGSQVHEKVRTSSLTKAHQHINATHGHSALNNMTATTKDEYELMLRTFARRAFRKSLFAYSASKLECKMHHGRRHSMVKSVIPDTFWQNGAQGVSASESRYTFFDDVASDTWFARHFSGSPLLIPAWNTMEDGIIKGAFWRFFAMLVEGGRFSTKSDDEDWSKLPVERWSVNKGWKRVQPTVIVKMRIDIRDKSRPIEFLTDAMTAEAGHPIFVDTARRIVESMQRISQWKDENVDRAHALMTSIVHPASKLKDRQKGMEKIETWYEIRSLLTKDPFEQAEFRVDQIGRDALTHSVLAYLSSNFDVHSSALINIRRNTQIGDVALII